MRRKGDSVMKSIFWLRAGAISGFLAVALGAFGAHGLRARLEALGTAATYQTAVHYHLAHALALLVVALLPARGKARDVAGVAFLVGTVLFSGSLYVLAVSGQKWLGAITPFGGVGFLTGWVALAFTGKEQETGVSTTS